MMITSKRPTDIVSFVLHILVRELREAIVLQLEDCYGSDFLKLGILPYMPEYALRQNWSRTELLKSDDPVIWLKLLQGNWRQAFASVIAAEREGDAIALLRLRNKVAHTNEVNAGDAAEAVAALERLLTAFARPMPSDFQALALECSLLGWSCLPSPVTAVIPTDTQLLPQEKTTMPASTNAIDILSQLVREQPRTRLDLFRSLQCPSHELWVFFNSRNPSQYIVRMDQRRRPWPDYWIHDSLRIVQLDLVTLHLTLTIEYKRPGLNRMLVLNVKARAQVQVLKHAEAARKIALGGEHDVQYFLDSLRKALRDDLTSRHLDHGKIHGSYTQPELQEAMIEVQPTIQSDCLQFVRLDEITFGDPVTATLLKDREGLSNQTELAIAKIMDGVDIFNAAAPFIKAQQDRSLELCKHECILKTIKLASDNNQRNELQKIIANQFRLIKKLNLTDAQQFYFMAQLDREVAKLVVESERLKSEDNNAIREQVVQMFERIQKAMNQQFFTTFR